MAACASSIRPTADLELNISRQWTEDQPIGSVHLSATPLRDTELKRRRLVSECSGGLLPKGDLRRTSSSQSEEQLLLGPEVETLLRRHLYDWAKKLVGLQPKVHMSDHLIECAVCLFKHVRFLQMAACQAGRLEPAHLASEQLLMHDLIACWWVAMKQCSVRTAVPNRTLMSRATDADPALLGQRELDALLSMRWNVNSVLRAHGCSQ